MGEVLVFAGRAAEAEQWVRKSMRLNPYHPTRYWTHLVRALFHQGRFAEALEAFERIDKPRKDDLTYHIGTLEQSGDHATAVSTAMALQRKFPDFNPAAFVDTLPFQREDDRNSLLKPLRSAIGEALNQA